MPALRLKLTGMLEALVMTNVCLYRLANSIIDNWRKMFSGTAANTDASCRQPETGSKTRLQVYALVQQQYTT